MTYFIFRESLITITLVYEPKGKSRAVLKIVVNISQIATNTLIFTANILNLINIVLKESVENEITITQ